MLSNDLRALTRVAAELAREVNDGEDHTVAAALLTVSGAIVTGVNAYHFLGGPCAEVTALANHAATHTGDPVTTVVAVSGVTGQVIPPCGKCRQILFDLDPAINCIVRTSNGHYAIPVSELLPHAYDWRAAETHQQKIYMWEGYEPLIRSQAKQQTIRLDDPFTVGPADIVFEKESGEVVTIPAQVTEIVRVTRADLTEQDAQLDGFKDLEELLLALDRHYPGIEDHDPVDIVKFRVA